MSDAESTGNVAASFGTISSQVVAAYNGTALPAGPRRLKLLLALLLDLGYLLAGVVALPWFVYRLARRGDAEGFLSRFGVGLEVDLPSSIWLHGASAGEILLLQPLVRRLERDFPNTPLVVSVFSSTGLAAARSVFPRHCVVLFPFDLSVVIGRFLRRLRPRLVVIVEGDLWPNFLLALRHRDIPVVVMNGRMSPTSCRRHAKTRLIPSLIRSMPFIAVQREEHVHRLQHLGVERGRLHVTGNMKYDLAPPPSDSNEVGALRERLGYGARDIVMIGGSLHRGEDDVLLRAWRQLSSETDRPIALVLVPRYPADSGQTEKKAREHGGRALLKTAVDGGEEAPGIDGVLIVDTLGELRALYALADIAFVGGSLFSRGHNRGGHNLMEPAIAGIPVLFGPHHSSFAETAEALVEAGAGAVVHDEDELARHLLRLVEDESGRQRMGMKARAAILSRQGATERNYTLLQPLLRSGSKSPPVTGSGGPQAAAGSAECSPGAPTAGL